METNHMSDLYHTNVFPEDSNGQPIKPMDLVIIDCVPELYWTEPGCSVLQSFAGCYGLVTYHPGEGECEPFYLGNKEHPGWTSGDRKLVFVLGRQIIGDRVMTYDFWLDPKNLTRIPFNSFVMNIFSQLPWQMQEVDGPSSELFIKEGMPEFAYLKKIMQTPYKKLAFINAEAMAKLDEISVA
jgi:hypothetical protein